MNLTVKALRETESSCESLLTTDIVKGNAELKADLENLSLNIKGCMSMVNDLETCHSSLLKAGFTDEWFSIMNKDNRLVTVCNIEMPKFFGDDNTKYRACMEGILDTLKVWIAKAWEFIKRVFNAIAKAVHELLVFWRRDNTKKWVITHALPKTAEFMGEKAINDNRTKLTVKSKDLDTVDRYVSALTRMLEVLVHVDVAVMNGNANMAGPDHGEQAVYQQIAETLNTYGINVNDKIVTGFRMLQGGIEFSTMNDIADKEFLITDQPALGTAEAFLADLVKNAQRIAGAHEAIQKNLKPMMAHFEDIKKKAEATILSQKADTMEAKNAANLIPIYTAALKNATVYSTFLAKCMAQFQNLSIEIDKYVRSRDAAVRVANSLH